MHSGEREKGRGITWLVGTLVVLAVAVLATVGGAARAQQAPRVVTQLECPLGCGSIEGFTIFGSLVAKEHPWLVFQVQETPGYLYNVREMGKNDKRWKTTAFGTEDTVIQLFFQGGKPELKEFYPEPIKIKWKLLYGIAWPTQGMWFATFDPNLKSMKDLKGKRLGLGLRTQSDWGGDARIFLETGYGITPQNADLRYLGPVGASEAMLDGRVDAVAMGMLTTPGGKNWMATAPMRLLEASGRKIYYIPIDKEAVDKVNKKYSTTYQTITVPRGTLKDQDRDFLVGVDRAYTAVHPDFHEDLAYELLKMIVKFRERMVGLHPLFKIINEETMVDGLTEENTHPGAVRALKEIGWWDTDARKKSVPVTYPEK